MTNPQEKHTPEVGTTPASSAARPPVILWAVDANGVIILADGSGLKSLRVESKDLVGRTVLEVYPEVEQVYRNCLVGEESDVDVLIDGVLLRTSFAPIRDKSGLITGAVGSSFDVTLEMSKDDALHEKEQSYRALFEQAADGVFIADSEGKLMDVNANGCAMIGYTRDQLLGRSLNELLPEDHRESDPAQVERLRSGEVIIRERDLLKRDGTIIRVEINASVTSDGRIQGIVRDITERKRAEAASEEAARKWQTTFDAVRDVVWLLDNHHRILMANRATSTLLGRNPENVLGFRCWEIVHGTTRPILECPVIRVNKTLRRETSELELGGRHLRIVADPVIDGKGELAGCVHILSDITEQKKAEKALRESDEELARMNRALRMLSDSNQALIRITDEPTLLQEVCRVAVEIGGYRFAWVGFAEQDEAKNVRIAAYNGSNSESFDATSITWGDDPEHGRGPTSIAIRTGKPCIAHNIPGNPAFAPSWEAVVEDDCQSSIALPLIIEDRTIGVLCIYSDNLDSFDSKEVDILRELAGDVAFGIGALRTKSERDRAEVAVRSLNSWQDAILSAIPDIVVEVDKNKVYTWANQAGREFFGDDIIGKEASYYFVGQQEVYEIVHPIFEGAENTIYVESWQRRKDGQKRLLAWWCRTLKDADGNVTGALSTARDITEQRQTEEVLRASEEVLRESQSVAGLGNYVLDISAGSWVSSRILDEVFGINADFERTPAGWLDIIHPEWREIMSDYLRVEVVEKRGRFDKKYKIIRQLDGEERWVHGLGRLEFDSLGNPVRMIGTIQDVTQQQLADEQIRSLNASLESRIIALTQPLNDTSNLGLADILDLRDIQMIQDAFAEATGVASIITDTQGVPLTKPSSFCRLCEHIIRGTEKGRANCFYSDSVIGRKHVGGPIMQPCLSGGLWDSGTSICVGEHHIANWLIGQVLEEPLDVDKMMDYARTIGAEESEFREALSEVTRMPREQFEKVSQALYIIANQLSRMALQNVQQARFIAERKLAEKELRDQRWRLESIIEGTNAGTWEWNIQTRQTVVNKTWAQMVGYSLEELEPTSDKTWEALMHPDDLKKAAELLDRHLSGELTYYECECRLKHKDGHWVWILDRGQVVTHTTDGKPLMMFGTHTDITERKRIENALRISEARFRSIVEESPMGIHMYDLNSEGVLIFAGANPSADRILGINHHELIGKTILEAFPGLESTEVPEKYLLAAKDGIPWFSEQVFYQDNFISGAFEAHAFQTKPGSMVTMFLDVTEKKRTETALRESEEKLRAILSSMEDILFVLSFEGVFLEYRAPVGNQLYVPPEQFIGKRFHDVLPSQAVEKIDRAFSRFIEDSVNSQTDYSLDINGETCWFDARLSPHRDGDGQVNGVTVVVRDISMRKRAEMALQESEQQLRSIFHVAPTGIGVVRDRVFIDVNDRVCKMVGYSREELIGQSARMVYPTTEEFEWVGREKYRQVAETGSGTVKTRWLRRDGSILDILLSSTPIDKLDHSKGVTFTALDITQQTQAEIAIQESEARYRTLFDYSPDGVMLMKDGFFVTCNQKAIDLFQSTRESIVGLSPDALSPSKQPDGMNTREAARVHLKNVQEHGYDSFEWLHQRANGEQFDAEVKLVAVRLSNELHIVAFVHDISERKRTERERETLTRQLAGSHQRLATMSRQMLDSQEQERRRIARELHDEVGQLLTAMKINLQSLMNVTRAGRWKSEYKTRLQDQESLIDTMIQQIRQIALELRPSILDDLGLLPAFRWYLDQQAQRGKLQVALKSSEMPDRLDPALENTCYRVLQEAVTNILRHAHAEHVNVFIGIETDYIRLAIHDDGNGFDVEQARSRAAHGQSFGLLGMQERVELIGGTLSFSSSPGKGTEITALFPVVLSKRSN